MNYDICIIGGGPGGYSAAIRGVQLGGKVALVERESLGGTCLNHGCIPTKNLYAMSELLRQIGEGDKFGVKAHGVDFDFDRAMEGKAEVVTHLRGGLEKLFKEHKIDIFNGRGTINSPGRVQVETPLKSEIIEAKNIIIATGSEAADIPPLRIDGKNIIGNREVLALPKMPASLLIVGGGIVGCEFANIFARIGTKVTILEQLDRILPSCEKEVSRLIKKRFEERGIEIICGQSVVLGEVSGNSVKVGLSDEKEITADKVLVAVGRRLNSFGLDLEEAGIAVENSAIRVNEKMETSVSGIYAVGDVTGGWNLAHVAAQEGKVAAANAMGKEAQMDYRYIPAAIYIHPEIASVGRGEESLKKEGIAYNVGRFPYLANGKAIAMREEDGFVKVLTSKGDGSTLGVHIMGAHASDLIAEATLAMKKACTAEDIADTIHAHPSLAESLQEAWEDTEGLAIHKMGRRRQ
ncbi:MAG: dihydrolipoyl dehydrogenase [Proteobacteria bacterium]|nr:dihydrolipoyl dehydrogenase [Pseudomonadota bacterium]